MLLTLYVAISIIMFVVGGIATIVAVDEYNVFNRDSSLKWAKFWAITALASPLSLIYIPVVCLVGLIYVLRMK